MYITDITEMFRLSCLQLNRYGMLMTITEDCWTTQKDCEDAILLSAPWIVDSRWAVMDLIINKSLSIFCETEGEVIDIYRRTYKSESDDGKFMWADYPIDCVMCNPEGKIMEEE